MQVNINAYKPEKPEENGIDLTSERGIRLGFVDINEPVLVPIPSAAGSESATRYEAHYPIADPRAGLKLDGKEPAPGHGIVDGFYATKFENKQGKRDKNNDVICFVNDYSFI